MATAQANRNCDKCGTRKAGTVCTRLACPLGTLPDWTSPAPDTGRTAEEMAAYVLIKRGLYWRPNAMGYTGVLAEAGFYTEADARARADGDGTTMQLASEATEFAPACWQETKIAVLSQQVAHLRAENANLRDRVREAEGAGRGPSDTGSHPTGGTPDGFPSLRDVDPSRMQWQPIATIPKDCKKVLLYRPLAGESNDPVITIRRTTKTSQHCWPDTIPLGCDGQNFTEGSCYATHWMPLPPPPALGIEARSAETSGSAEGESPTPQGGMPTPLPDSRSENTGGRDHEGP